MKFVLKSKTQIIVTIIVLEALITLFIWNNPIIKDVDFITWFSAIQFVVLAMLFMPEGRHGVGDTRMPNYQSVKQQWDAMSQEEKNRVAKESRHDMLMGFCYLALVTSSILFAVFIWVPILLPAIKSIVF